MLPENRKLSDQPKFSPNTAAAFDFKIKKSDLQSKEAQPILELDPRGTSEFISCKLFGLASFQIKFIKLVGTSLLTKLFS